MPFLPETDSIFCSREGRNWQMLKPMLSEKFLTELKTFAGTLADTAREIVAEYHALDYT